MPRLNKKSTKAAIVKLLKVADSNIKLSPFSTEKNEYKCASTYLLKLAEDLEIDIQPEEYQG